MYQITWMLGFLPAWFWNFSFIIGITLLLLTWTFRFIPFVNLYRLPLQVVGVIVLGTSIWFLGAAANEEKWKVKVNEAEEKVKIAELKAEKLNDELRILTDQKTAGRDEKTKTIIKYIDSWITKEILKEVEGPERIKIEKVIEYIERCPVPKELLDIHNQAVKGEGMKK